MIDLEKLEKEIDELLESETSSSLTNWLLNKRFGNLNSVLGNGTFVSLESQKQPIFSNNKGTGNFNKSNNNSPNTPNNRRAA